MKNSKKLFLIVLSVLTVAFISCNKVTAIPTFKVSDIAGMWSGNGVISAIDNNENMTIVAPISTKYTIPETDCNSEKPEYTINVDNAVLTGSSIKFTSTTSGTATSSAGTTEINKVQ